MSKPIGCSCIIRDTSCTEECRFRSRGPTSSAIANGGGLWCSFVLSVCHFTLLFQFQASVLKWGSVYLMRRGCRILNTPTGLHGTLTIVNIDADIAGNRLLLAVWVTVHWILTWDWRDMLRTGSRNRNAVLDQFVRAAEESTTALNF